MSYDIRKKTDGYHVIDQRDGKEVATSKSRAGAEEKMRGFISADVKPTRSPGTRAESVGKTQMILDDTYTPRPVTRQFRGGALVSNPNAPVEEPQHTTFVETPAGVKEVPAALGGGILKKLKKAATKPLKDAKKGVGKKLDALDDGIFGGEGLGSNLRKLREEKKKRSPGARGR